MNMKAKLFTFSIRDFEEVYAVIDSENKRLHVSCVNYEYSITLNTTKDFQKQLAELTKWKEGGFSKRVCKVVKSIIDDLEIE